MEKKTPVIILKNIEKKFGYIQALNGMNFHANAGEVTAIVGDNGSGKSTLVKIITGCLAPDSGEIYINNQKYQQLSVKEAINLGITTVYQDLALDPCKDCAENIFLGHEIIKYHLFLDRKAMRKKTAELLKSLNIHIPDITQPVNKMSGGQRQALAIARAIYTNGNIFIFDEPTSAMGIKETEHIMHIFKQLKQQGKTIILISHNLFQVFDIADQICFMQNGKLIDYFKTSDTSPEKLHARITQKEETFI